MEEELTMDIDLRLYWRLFLRWWWLLALTAILAGGVAYGVSRWMLEPVYQASVQLLIQPSTSYGSTNYQDILAGQRVAATYAEILNSRPVIESAFRELGFDMMQILQFSETDYPVSMTVQPLRDTQVIEILVESKDRRLAMDFANQVAQTFIEYNQDRQVDRFRATQQEIQQQIDLVDADRARLEQRLEGVSDTIERGQIEIQIAQLRETLSRYNTVYQNVTLTQLQSVDLISVVEPARFPRSPVRPRVMMNTAIAGMLGAMVAVGGIALREMLDTSLRSPEEAESLTQSPVLGKIWYEEGIPNGDGPQIVLHKPLSLTAEAFRLLRANLQFAAVDKPLKAVLISSPGPTEGKSTISLNLALALGATGMRVIIIDADMRRPRIGEYAGVEREPGLSGLLLDRDGDMETYLHTMVGTEAVRVLPAGQSPPNPTELLGSRRMAEVLAACQQLADIVIVDSPPVLAAADAVVLAAQTDGTLLVMQPGSSDRKAVSQAAELLHRSGAHILGSVLNKVQVNGHGYYYYSYYYTDEDKASPGKFRWPWHKKEQRQRKAHQQHAA